MHQTTSGETPKVKVYDRNHIESFIAKIRLDFEKSFNEKDCLYQKSHKLIDNPVLNFLNVFDSSFKGEHLKSLIKKEFDDCEKVYPFLGDLFVMKFFDVKCVLNNNFLLQKSNKNTFIRTIRNKNIKKVCEEIFKNSSLERKVNIKSSHSKEIILEKVDDIIFNLKHDTDFLGNKNEIEVKDYRFIIIDGFIESVGEIYHLLHFAAKSKEPHLIFCYGVSQEVKSVILQNNANGITQIFPISMILDDATVNILNDLAVIHNCDIVSSLKGQTISQETRKELPVGKRALIGRERISFVPVCENEKIRKHIDFLNNRISEAQPGTNTDVIKDRVRSISSKAINLYVPEVLLKNHEFARELDYVVRFLSNCEKSMSTFKIGKNNKIMIPEILINYIDKKVNSLRDVFYNIEKLVLFEEV